MMTVSSLRKAVPLRQRKSLKVLRARTYEYFGSYRYSAPALYGLDREMARRLPTHGVFLEVGANDGFSQSNTYYLERARGWTGILIEPLPSLYARCRRLRPSAYCVRAACVAVDDPRASVELVDLDLMSVALGQQDRTEETKRLGLHAGGRTVAAPARSVSAIIDQSPYASIDFMSVDVEGAEVPLIMGIEFKRHTPRWLLVETSHPEAIAELVDPYMVMDAKLTHHDYLFRAREPTTAAGAPARLHVAHRTLRAPPSSSS